MRSKASTAQTSNKSTAYLSGDLVIPVFGIALVFIGLLVGSYLIYILPTYGVWIVLLQTALCALGTGLLVVSQARIKENLLEPLTHLKEWAVRMRDGNLSAQIPVPVKGEFAQVARDINDVGRSLNSLSRELDHQVREQTQRLEKKSRSLEILYDVAASSNTARDIDELLVRYLETLANILDAHAGTVRLLTEDDQLRLIGSTGLDNPIVGKEKSVPIERCLCAQNFSQRIISCKNKRFLCGNLLYSSLPYGDKTDAIAIPLQYRNRTLGIYNLFIEDEKTIKIPDIVNILTNIGQHLSLAIEKARLDDETHRLTIMQERTMLAHELHDSLAQTLASLRFRVSTLSRTLQEQGDQPALQEIMQLQNGLDEANSELRELLAHFRVHMDERGLIPATENVIERFKSECDIAVFFQNECANIKLPPIVEVQVLHIIQESLTNIRKHSQAGNVRILIRCNNENHLHVLIEDDGVGIDESTIHGSPGEHVGLSIMQERALRIGGVLNIETEPGEGTRIELDFDYSQQEEEQPLDEYPFTEC
jgi:two-component system nitrate/nitrite sensor histidine kinase NarX